MLRFSQPLPISICHILPKCGLPLSTCHIQFQRKKKQWYRTVRLRLQALDIVVTRETELSRNPAARETQESEHSNACWSSWLNLYILMQLCLLECGSSGSSAHLKIIQFEFNGFVLPARTTSSFYNFQAGLKIALTSGLYLR